MESLDPSAFLAIGLVGLPGAGKGIAMHHMNLELRKKGNSVYTTSLSDIIKEIATEKSIEHTRENFKKIADQLRNEKGTGILAEISIHRIFTKTPSLEKGTIILIDSIRNSGEVSVLSRTWRSNFYLIGITAPYALLISRMRNRKREDETRFINDDMDVKSLLDKELGKNEPEYGNDIQKCLERANYLIANDGTIEQYMNKMDAILDQINW